LPNARIRPIRPEDATDFWELVTRPNVMWGTVYVPTFTMESAQESCQPNPEVPKFVAEVDGKMVGVVGLMLGKGRTQHSCELFIYVHDNYQGMGLGRRLMNAALDLADNWLMLERVYLSVYTDNDRAKALYESLGFELEGRSPGYFRRDGVWADVYHMSRLRGRALAPSAPVPLAPAAKGTPVAVTVRGALPEDVPAIYALRMQPEVLRSMGRLPTWTEAEARKEYTNLPRGHHLLVAEVAGQVVGMAYLQQLTGRRTHVGQVRSVVVAREWQGRGVGSALLREVLRLGEGWLGLRRLELTVHADNAPAIAAYRRAGFAIEATHRAAYVRDGRFIDTCLMGRTSSL